MIFLISEYEMNYIIKIKLPETSFLAQNPVDKFRSDLSQNLAHSCI